MVHLVLPAILLVHLILPAVTVQAEAKQGFEWITESSRHLYHYDKPVLTQFFNMPQVVDVGQGYVEYKAERVKANEYWIDCPTSSFHIKTANTEVWTLNRSEQVLSKCIWQLWADSDTGWLEIEDLDSSLTLSESTTSASLRFFRVMEDNSTFQVIWTFDNLAKASVNMTAGQSRAYAVTWHIECPNVIEETEGDNSLRWTTDTGKKALLNYFDARLIHNETQLSSLGQSGRKAILTFANRTLEAGESILIDPTVDTFTGESARDGYIYKAGASYPPDNQTSVSSNGAYLTVGQRLTAGVYYRYRSFWSFNTSSIDDNSTLDRAVIRFYPDYVFAVSQLYVLDSVDYGTTLDAGDYAISGTNLNYFSDSNVQKGQWHEVTVPSASMSYAINLTGLSQFRMMCWNDFRSQNMTADSEYIDPIASETADYAPQLLVYYEQEEDGETKGTGAEEGASTGGGESLEEVFEETAERVIIGLREQGLWLLAGSMVVVVAGGVYAGTKTRRVSRRAKGKRGGSGSRASGKAGGTARQPRGSPKRRQRDARGRFK